MRLGDLIEGIVLHSFAGMSAFGAENLAFIEQMQSAYGLDLNAADSHKLTGEYTAMAFDGNFWVFVAAMAMMAFSPGPGLAAIVATVFAGGARRALWFCLGVIAGDLVWLTLSLGGLALIAQQIPAVFDTIKGVGVLYLLYLAVKTWKSSDAGGGNRGGAPAKSVFATGVAGFCLTMGNPKVMLFYLALLPNLVGADPLSVSQALVLCLVVITTLATAFTFYVVAAAKTRTALTNNWSGKIFKRMSAFVLGGVAVWIAAK